MGEGYIYRYIYIHTHTHTHIFLLVWIISSFSCLLNSSKTLARRKKKREWSMLMEACWATMSSPVQRWHSRGHIAVLQSIMCPCMSTSVKMELVTPGDVPTLVNIAGLHQACSDT